MADEERTGTRDHLRKAFGLRLREARRRAGLTQEDLAARAGVPTIMINRLENGRATISALLHYVGVCEVLGADPGPLLRPPSCPSCGDVPPPGFTCNDCGKVVANG